MSEPLIERLSRFTPDAGGLDRDALLFAAGRRSARPNRGWKRVSAVLAGTQLLALVLLWPHPNGLPHGKEGLIAGKRSPARPLEQRPAASPTGPDTKDRNIWSVCQEVDDVQLEDRVAEHVVLMESEPVLRAFGPPPDSILN